MQKDRPCPRGPDATGTIPQAPMATGRPRLLTIHNLCGLLQVSRSSVERSICSDPGFPQPRRLACGRLVRFLEAEVSAYITQLPKAKYDDHAFDPDDPRESS